MWYPLAEPVLELMEYLHIKVGNGWLRGSLLSPPDRSNVMNELIVSPFPAALTGSPPSTDRSTLPCEEFKEEYGGQDGHNTRSRRRGDDLPLPCFSTLTIEKAKGEHYVTSSIKAGPLKGRTMPTKERIGSPMFLPTPVKPSRVSPVALASQVITSLSI